MRSVYCCRLEWNFFLASISRKVEHSTNPHAVHGPWESCPLFPWDKAAPLSIFLDLLFIHCSNKLFIPALIILTLEQMNIRTPDECKFSSNVFDNYVYPVGIYLYTPFHCLKSLFCYSQFSLRIQPSWISVSTTLRTQGASSISTQAQLLEEPPRRNRSISCHPCVPPAHFMTDMTYNLFPWSILSMSPATWLLTSVGCQNWKYLKSFVKLIFAWNIC
jgi:hypothetical protein